MTRSPHEWRPPSTAPVRSIKARIWGSVLSGMTVFGFLISLMTIYPRMTVTISGPSDERLPLSSSFLISNDGYLPAYSVSAMCLIKTFNLRGTQAVPREAQLTPISGPPMPPPLTLYPGAKESVPFSNCFITEPSNLLTAADIGLRVKYRPMFWFHLRAITQEFYAKSIGLNHYVWYGYPAE